MSEKNGALWSFQIDQWPLCEIQTMALLRTVRTLRGNLKIIKPQCVMVSCFDISSIRCDSGNLSSYLQSSPLVDRHAQGFKQQKIDDTRAHVHGNRKYMFRKYVNKMILIICVWVLKQFLGYLPNLPPTWKGFQATVTPSLVGSK